MLRWQILTLFQNSSSNACGVHRLHSIKNVNALLCRIRTALLEMQRTAKIHNWLDTAISFFVYLLITVCAVVIRTVSLSEGVWGTKTWCANCRLSHLMSAIRSSTSSSSRRWEDESVLLVTALHCPGRVYSQVHDRIVLCGTDPAHSLHCSHLFYCVSTCSWLRNISDSSCVNPHPCFCTVAC